VSREFADALRPTLSIEGDTRPFPVRRIWCVGRNYAEHAREMGADPDREPPFFFGKPADAVTPGGTLAFPRATSDLHHEVELAVALGGHGRDLTPEAAGSLIFGYALALDMTRRDLQAEAKRLARPWDMGKGFDQSCPIGPIRPADSPAPPRQGRLSLAVNGQVRQHGDVAEMIWSLSECVAALSRLVDLMPGDVLLTGTPAGVGSVRPGDLLEARCDLAPSLSVTYAGEA
jgi:fumarylpyruvate hydrolase